MFELKYNPCRLRVLNYFQNRSSKENDHLNFSWPRKGRGKVGNELFEKLKFSKIKERKWRVQCRSLNGGGIEPSPPGTFKSPFVEKGPISRNLYIPYWLTVDTAVSVFIKYEGTADHLNFENKMSFYHKNTQFIWVFQNYRNTIPWENLSRIKHNRSSYSTQNSNGTKIWYVCILSLIYVWVWLYTFIFFLCFNFSKSKYCLFYCCLINNVVLYFPL